MSCRAWDRGIGFEHSLVLSILFANLVPFRLSMQRRACHRWSYGDSTKKKTKVPIPTMRMAEVRNFESYILTFFIAKHLLTAKEFVNRPARVQFSNAKICVSISHGCRISNSSSRKIGMWKIIFIFENNSNVAESLLPPSAEVHQACRGSAVVCGICREKTSV